MTLRILPDLHSPDWRIAQDRLKAHVYREHVPWYTRPEAWQSRWRLRQYKDKHRGQRCFILGNGPSLRKTDLTRLRHEYTFGMNRIYLLFPDMGFQTTYFLSVNRYVIQQCRADIETLRMPKFITWRSRNDLTFDDQTIFVPTSYLRPHYFSKSLRPWIWEGNTVTFLAMQLAYYMGFTQVILIGVDHHFNTLGPVNKLITSQSADTNHFSPDYFPAGFRWQLPDLEMSERGYHIARDTFAAAGREILDATVEGRLHIFPKVAFASLF